MYDICRDRVHCSAEHIFTQGWGNDVIIDRLHEDVNKPYVQGMHDYNGKAKKPPQKKKDGTLKKRRVAYGPMPSASRTIELAGQGMCLPDVALVSICATLSVDSDLWHRLLQLDHDQLRGQTQSVTTIVVDANLRDTIQNHSADWQDDDDKESDAESDQH